MDYYDALYSHHEARVTLSSGRTLRLRRAGLGRYYVLQHLGAQIPTAPLEERVALYSAWLEHGGADPAALSLADLAPITQAIKTLNRPRGMLAWDLVGPESEVEDEPRLTDYEGRHLARIVHTLAYHYHWPLDVILELPREAALAHCQEIMLERHQERRWQHALSEVAWEYDKSAKVSRYKPLPEPVWASGRKPAPRGDDTPQWVKDKYWPKGVVIDLQHPENRKRLKDDNGRNEGPAGRDAAQ